MIWLLKLLNPLGSIAKELADAYVAKQDATTERQRIEADVQVRQLEARQQVLLEEQKHALTRWIRPAIAAPFAIYIWKVVVWDKVLGWGVTDDLSVNFWHLCMIVMGAYFLTRPVEKWWRSR